MDLNRVIRELIQERERLQRIIESLESMKRLGKSKAPVPTLPKRRGRKSMDSAAREEVSARMKRYWAQRRAATQPPAENPESDPESKPPSDQTRGAAGAE